jgi:hypothetical protein
MAFSLPQLQERAGQAPRLYLPYTVDSIADFIGWKRYKVEASIFRHNKNFPLRRTLSNWR